MFDKVYVNTLSAAFGMLAKERVDAVVCTDYYGRNIINSHPEYLKKLKATDYKVTNGTKVYIALSRKSAFSNQADLFKKTAEEMYQSDAFRQAMLEFRSQHPEFYL